MKKAGNRIVEATEKPLYTVYLQKGYDKVMDFYDFLYQCQKLGTKIIDEKENKK